MSKDEWKKMKPDNVNYVYHYTSEYNASLILTTMCILPTIARVKKFGRGVFLTELSPDLSTDRILGNNYQGNNKYRSKTQCAFALPKADFNVHRIYDPRDPKRDLWRIDTEVDLKKTEFYLINR